MWKEKSVSWAVRVHNNRKIWTSGSYLIPSKGAALQCASSGSCSHFYSLTLLPSVWQCSPQLLHIFACLHLNPLAGSSQSSSSCVCFPDCNCLECRLSEPHCSMNHAGNSFPIISSLRACLFSWTRLGVTGTLSSPELPAKLLIMQRFIPMFRFNSFPPRELPFMQKD